MIAFNPENISIVSLEEVEPNDWNPKDKNTKEYQLIKQSIEKEGQKVPIVVREYEGTLQIIDGEQRYTALLELGEPFIAINNIGEVEDALAKNETLWYQLQVPFVEGLLSELIAKLKNSGVMLPYDKNEIDKLLTLDNFDLKSMLKTKEPIDLAKLVIVFKKEKPFRETTNMLDQVAASEQVSNRARALELLCADYTAGN